MDNYKGFSLFNDVEDNDLRTFNRARILANIAEDNTKNAKISPKGATLILNYFNCIPADERMHVQQKFTELMKEGGYVVGN